MNRRNNWNSSMITTMQLPMGGGKVYVCRLGGGGDSNLIIYRNICIRVSERQELISRLNALSSC